MYNGLTQEPVNAFCFAGEGINGHDSYMVVGTSLADFLVAKAARENRLEVALLEKKSDPRQVTGACVQTLVCFTEYWLGSIKRYNTRDKHICCPSDGFSEVYSIGG